MKRVLAVCSLFVTLLVFVGCSAEYYEIPAGYVGRVLTPTGWENEVRTSGQVDLREKDISGRYSVLVLLEATSTTTKEQFLPQGQDPAETDKEDHRVLTKSGTPLSVDVYVRLMLPDDQKARDSIFTLVTPQNSNNDRMKIITLENVYNRFARMDVRGKIRAIFANYEDYANIMSHYGEINDKIAAAVIQTFKDNGVPLKLQNAQLSNVKPDEKIWDATNDLAMAHNKAAAIDEIGAAMRRNPEYASILKWESLKEIAKSGSTSGTNTVIITDGSSTDGFAAAEYLRQRLQSSRRGSPPEETVAAEAPASKGKK